MSRDGFCDIDQLATTMPRQECAICARPCVECVPNLLKRGQEIPVLILAYFYERESQIRMLTVSTRCTAACPVAIVPVKHVIDSCGVVRVRSVSFHLPGQATNTHWTYLLQGKFQRENQKPQSTAWAIVHVEFYEKYNSFKASTLNDSFDSCSSYFCSRFSLPPSFAFLFVLLVPWIELRPGYMLISLICTESFAGAQRKSVTFWSRFLSSSNKWTQQGRKQKRKNERAHAS